MESVLFKANLVNLSTGQYWLKIDKEKGMTDCEGHGHKAVLYKSHFPATKAFTSVHSLLERHCCIHRLINHVYYKGQTSLLSFAPMTVRTEGCYWCKAVRQECGRGVRAQGFQGYEGTRVQGCESTRRQWVQMYKGCKGTSSARA